MLTSVVRIIKTHGLKGHMLIELLVCPAALLGPDSEMTDIASAFETLLGAEMYLVSSKEKLKIVEIFGITGRRVRVKFEGIDDKETAQQLNGCGLALDQNSSAVANMIGKTAYYEGKPVIIRGIYDFGAGIVVDTDGDMIRLQDLDFDC